MNFLTNPGSISVAVQATSNNDAYMYSLSISGNTLVGTLSDISGESLSGSNGITIFPSQNVSFNL